MKYQGSGVEGQRSGVGGQWPVVKGLYRLVVGTIVREAACLPYC
jgi:hypothetical protein